MTPSHLISSLQRKCEQYWSDNVNDTFDAGSLVVTLTDLVPYADYEIKRFTIKDVSVHTCCIDASDIHTSMQHVCNQVLRYSVLNMVR